MAKHAINRIVKSESKNLVSSSASSENEVEAQKQTATGYVEPGDRRDFFLADDRIFIDSVMRFEQCTIPLWRAGSCRQRLICRSARAQERAFLASLGADGPPGGFVHGAGCNFCAHTGFLDRIGVYELMPITDSLRALVLRSASHREIHELARREGMRTLQDEALRLVTDGVTTPAEILRSIYLTGGAR